MAHRAGHDVVERRGVIRVQRPPAVGVGWLVEVDAGLRTAVDGRQLEPCGPPGLLDAAAGEDGPPNGQAQFPTAPAKGSYWSGSSGCRSPSPRRRRPPPRRWAGPARPGPGARRRHRRRADRAARRPSVGDVRPPTGVRAQARGYIAARTGVWVTVGGRQRPTPDNRARGRRARNRSVPGRAARTRPGGVDRMARPAPGADRSVAILELLASTPAIGSRSPRSLAGARSTRRPPSLARALSHAHPAAPSRREALLAGPPPDRDRRRSPAGLHRDRLAGGARSPVGGDGSVVPCIRPPGRPRRRGRPDPSPGGRRPLDPVTLPLTPPLGALWMAWSDRPSVEAWLAGGGCRCRGPVAGRPARDPDAGYAVTRASPGCGSYRGRSCPPGAPRPRPIVTSAAPRPTRSAAGGDRAPDLLLTDADDAGTYRIADVAAPVFARRGPWCWWSPCRGWTTATCAAPRSGDRRPWRRRPTRSRPPCRDDARRIRRGTA